MSSTILSFNDLIMNLENVLHRQVVIEDIIDNISQNKELGFKEDEELCLIYYNDINCENPLAKYCKSYIIDKSSLSPVSTQFNKIIYNEEAIKELETINWNDVVVQKCYEGTLMTVFFHGTKWYVTTRRCLNASESQWVQSKSYRELFDEAMTFKFDDLNRNYCYHFVLLHHNNKNIVNYSDLGNTYRELIHVMTIEKGTLNVVDYDIPNIRKAETISFNSMNELLNQLANDGMEDEISKKIRNEGYVIQYTNNNETKLYKLQTSVYQKMLKIKPNNYNIDQNYLELYQKDKLNDFIPYFSPFHNEIINRISTSLKTISNELHALYHATRNKKYPELYNELPPIYRMVLYNLHGIYMQHKEEHLQNPDSKVSMVLNVHDIYSYLKNMSPKDLRSLYEHRYMNLNNPMFKFLDRTCMATQTQSILMFPNL